MILVGRGALLSRAASYAKRSSLVVDFACCPPGDSSSLVIKKIGIPLLETNDPNAALPPLLKECSDGVAFSTNNQFILQDEVLCGGVSFFNIHAGLVQQYRGVSEICIFAALCRGVGRYGVTLHRLLPSQQVDSGPVVSQLQFEVIDSDGFSSVLTKSLYACQRIFESNVSQILSKRSIEASVEVGKESYSYKHVVKLCREADSARLSRASDFGAYAASFPKLKGIVDSMR